MNDAYFTFTTVKAMMLVLILSLPPLAVAAVVGLLFGLFQAATQIQEQTLSFAFKLVAVIAVIILISRWGGSQLLFYARDLMDNMNMYIQ
jgi:type III secretion HrpO family protein